MKLYKSIIQNLSTKNFEELFLPENTQTGDKIVLKTPDSSQIFNVAAILADESIIIGDIDEQ
jgi:hypothetical protein